MARDHCGDATSTSEEAALVERVRNKRLGNDGRPEKRAVASEPRLDDEPPRSVPENEEPGLIDSMKGM